MAEAETTAYDHRFHCLSRVPIFAPLTDDARHEVAALAHTRHYDRNEVIYVPDDRPGLNIVHRGRVKAYRLTANGTEQLVRVVGEGDFLGETALFTSVPAGGFATALVPSEICSVSRKDMHDLLERYPGVALDLLEAMAGRLHSAEEQLSLLSGQPVAARLARHLLDRSVTAGSAAFTLDTTKKDLASFLGTTPETLSRRLTAMQADGLIDLGPRRFVKILDVDRLRSLLA